MEHGGHREGSGKPSVKHRAPGEFTLAMRLIDLAMPKAVKALLDALEATREVPKIIGRDEKGHPEYEYVSVPDHLSRINAAKALLAKRIPDLAHTTLAGDKENPIVIKIDQDDANA